MAMEVQVQITIPDVVVETVVLANIPVAAVWASLHRITAYPLERICPVCLQHHVAPVTVSYAADHLDWHNDRITILFGNVALGIITHGPVAFPSLTSQSADADAGTQERAGSIIVTFDDPLLGRLRGGILTFTITGMPFPGLRTIQIKHHYSFKRPARNVPVVMIDDETLATVDTRTSSAATGLCSFMQALPPRDTHLLIEGVDYALPAGTSELVITTNATDVSAQMESIITYANANAALGPNLFESATGL